MRYFNSFLLLFFSAFLCLASYATGFRITNGYSEGITIGVNKSSRFSREGNQNLSPNDSADFKDDSAPKSLLVSTWNLLSPFRSVDVEDATKAAQSELAKPGNATKKAIYKVLPDGMGWKLVFVALQ